MWARASTDIEISVDGLITDNSLVESIWYGRGKEGCLFMQDENISKIIGQRKV